METSEEIEEPSFWSRLGGSIKGVIVGVVLFLVGIPLLFWNEGRAVRRAEALEKGAEAVKSVSCDKVDLTNEGQLVHMNGLVKVAGNIEDSAFKISVNGVRLKRNVEMY